MRLALYQPDIPQNLGAAIRLSACLGVDLEIVEPCGFPLTDKALKRAALDYAGKARIARRVSLADLAGAHPGKRLVLIETEGPVRLHDFRFAADDTLMFGSESAGAPPALHDAADAVVRIPMAAGLRSLNVVTAAAMALSEAMRQTGRFDRLV